MVMLPNEVEVVGGATMRGDGLAVLQFGVDDLGELVEASCEETREDARRREARWHRVVLPFRLDQVGDARIYHAALQVGHDCLGNLLAKKLPAAPVVQVDAQRDAHDENLMLLLRDQRSKGLGTGQSPEEETKERGVFSECCTLLRDILHKKN